ncbi:MAG: asparagine synthase (glutamine-hydrolyzing) [Vicinamibacteria bacterium]
MCGLAGVLSLNGRPVLPGRLEAMTRSLAHRGPDGEGIADFGAGGFGHRRLSIIDLSVLGAQPMTYRDRYTIVYNGEIYNYVELKKELEGLGYSFQSESDTEVLLAAIACWDVDALSRLDGMFAFACWDAEKKRLLCARDRFGEKPFFFSVHDECFVFGSEIKALKAGGVPLAVNDEMLFGLLQHDVVQSLDRPESSFYRGVFSLKPAHWMEIRAAKSGVGEQIRYWEIPDQTTKLRKGERKERLLELLKRSVRRRMRADVPVGTSVSGGLDSSTIAALMASVEPGSTRLGFSARFDDPALDEGRHMETIQKATNLTWKQVWPNGDGLSDEIERLFYHQEEPFLGASPYAQWCVMRLARENGTKVLLDGQGADEFLAGYTHFFRPFLSNKLRTEPAAFLNSRSGLRALPGSAGQEALSLRFALQAFFPGAFSALGSVRRNLGPSQAFPWLGRDWSRQFSRRRPPFRAHKNLDAALRFFTAEYGLRTLLRYSDRSSMAFGVEVRLPFLDHQLVEFAFSCPDEDKLSQGSTKHLLRLATEGIVPDSIRLRTDKMGFQPPEEAWMKHKSMQKKVAAAFEDLRARGIVSKTTSAPAATTSWRVLMAHFAFRFAEGAISGLGA